MEEIIKALIELDAICIESIAPDRFMVWLDGKVFGIWDSTRKTFAE